MKYRQALIFLVLLSFNAFADLNKEISHLLQYVKSTDCQYERNGVLYSGYEAAEHIIKKYNYYIDEIDSAENFIKYAATKSKMSGKHYVVHCAGQLTVNSHHWLLAELKKFRIVRKQNINY